MSFLILIRGGGDLASGVALRLHRSGFQVVISELAQPLAVRRSVSFAEAVYSGNTIVEGCIARRVDNPANIPLTAEIIAQGQIPVLIDPNGDVIRCFCPDVIVDARMLKKKILGKPNRERLLIGLGPGFVAGKNCDAVVETSRGISMGRVIWEGSARANTRVPEAVAGHSEKRVLRAPANGIVVAHAEIGDRIKAGQLIAEVGGKPVSAAFKGVLRGLIHPGLRVKKDVKIGDLDPRGDPNICAMVSDKSLAVGGGVLEAILGYFKSSGREKWQQGNQSV